MRRSVPAFALLGLVAACDPTGNTSISSSSDTVRVANLISDAPTITVSAGGVSVASNVAFGAVSPGKLVRIDDQEFVTVRNSDNFVIGADSGVMTLGRRYTFYLLGTSADHAARFARDDTTFAAAGTVKLRFIHGSVTDKLNGLDLYVSAATDSLADIDPLVPSLAYAAASPYVVADTAFKRIRITQVGQPTALLDTTLATAIADSTVLTIVVSDKSGGGTPRRLGIVIDRAP